MWRLAREALNNAVRHSRAHTITVRCEVGDDSFSLMVRDDGCGFDPNSIPADHLGLRNMHHLAEQIQAHLTIESIREQGTTITIQVPLLRRAEHE